MMEWRDEGILLAVRPHGETSAIVEAFCANHGRHAGVVLGGVSRRMRPFLQPGVLAQMAWRARLDEHLGHFVVEPLRNRAAVALGDRLALAGIGAVAALLSAVLPERAPHPALFERTNALLDLLPESAGSVLETLHPRTCLGASTIASRAGIAIGDAMRELAALRAAGHAESTAEGWRLTRDAARALKRSTA